MRVVNDEKNLMNWDLKKDMTMTVFITARDKKEHEGLEWSL